MMQIESFFDERTWTLTYVVFDPATKDAVVIDPVYDYEPKGSATWTESVDAVTRFVKEEGLQLHYILETHAHADHISGAQLLRERFPGAKVAIGERIVDVQRTFQHIFNLPEDFKTDGSQFDKLLSPGKSYAAGTLSFEILATPGHTPACTSIVMGDAVFTGDALFNPDVGTGRCDFPGGSARDMYNSVAKVLYALPDDTKAYVGHDYPPESREVLTHTTIAEQKANNVALPAGRSEEDFVAWRQKRDRSLDAPRLLFQSVQVNVDAGHLPAKDSNDIRYLRIPLNVFRPEPTPDSELRLEGVDEGEEVEVEA